MFNGPYPVAEIQFDDKLGYVFWRYLPMELDRSDKQMGIREGKVRDEGSSSELMLVGKSKPWGKIINFSFYNFDLQASYKLVSDGNYQCKVKAGSQVPKKSAA